MMKKIYLILTFFLSLPFFSQEFKWGMTGNVHSASIEGIHDFSRGRIAPSLGFFAEIPLETFQRSIYSPLRYYIFPVLEYSMEGEKTILEQGRQYYRNDYVAFALYGKFHFYINLRDDDMKKMSISVSGAFGYVVNDKLEAYIRFDQGLTKVYPNYDVMRTWNRLLGVGISYYFN